MRVLYMRTTVGDAGGGGSSALLPSVSDTMVLGTLVPGRLPGRSAAAARAGWRRSGEPLCGGGSGRGGRENEEVEEWGRKGEREVRSTKQPIQLHRVRSARLDATYRRPAAALIAKAIRVLSLCDVLRRPTCSTELSSISLVLFVDSDVPAFLARLHTLN